MEPRSKEELRKFFPEGLVFSENHIAGNNERATGIRIDFDSAYEILGNAVLEGVLWYGSEGIKPEEREALLAALQNRA